MKRIILAITIAMGGMMYAQQTAEISSDTQGNVFIEAESPSANDGNMAQVDSDPGDPNAPIDDYIPFLLVAAVGLIYYAYRRKMAIN